MWTMIFRCLAGRDTLGRHVPEGDPARRHFVDATAITRRRGGSAASGAGSVVGALACGSEC